jgi:F-type H+-transporting ATPase subunit b
MSDTFHDPMFFYAVAFFIFLGLAWKFGRKPMLGWLDGEILKIRDELEQARKLRVEAEALLAEYKLKQGAAMKETEGILAHAKEEAVRLRAEAEADLKDALIHHEQQAAARIRLAEAEAMTDVRNAVIEGAMKLARETLASRIDDAATAKLTEQAIAEMPKLGASKAKAA